MKFKLKQNLLILSVFIFAAFALSHRLEVSADSFIVLDTVQTVEIKENEEANVMFQQTLKNSNADQLIGGYQFNLPYTNLQGITARLDSAIVDYTLKDENGIQLLDLDFGNNAIKPNESKTLTVSFKISAFVKDFGNVKYTTITPVQYPNRQGTNTITISYPSHWGNPSFTSNNDYSISNSIITLTSLSPTLFTWGRDYSVDLKTSYVVEKKNETSQAIVNLIQENENQDVDYSEIENALAGYYDDANNYYYLSKKIDNDSLGLGFKARVQKSLDYTIIKKNSYTNDIKSNSSIGAELINELNKDDDATIKLSSIFDYLISKFTPNAVNDSYNIDQLGHIWNSESETVTSFEYSYFLASAAQRLGFNVEMKFGYAVIPYLNQSTNITPHFWVIVETNDSKLLIDPYLTDLTNIRYFTSSPDFDRITFGSWEPNQDYNPALGLLSQDNVHPGIEKAEIEDNFISDLGSFSAGLNMEQMNSGFFNHGSLTINNPKTYADKVVQIKFNEKDIMQNISYVDLLKPLVLPGENTFAIVNLREGNIFKNGTFNSQVQINFEKSPEIDFVKALTYSASPTLVLVVIFLITVTITGIILMIWTKRKKKKY